MTGMSNKVVALLVQQAQAQADLAKAITSGQGREFLKEREGWEQAREQLETAAAEAKEREAAAQEAERVARIAIDRLALLKAEANSEVDHRERAIAAREKAAEDREAALEQRDREWTRRSQLLRDANVVGFARG